jgi:hypothetical protein
MTTSIASVTASSQFARLGAEKRNRKAAPTREFVGPVGLEPTTYGLQIWLLAMQITTRHHLA